MSQYGTFDTSEYNGIEFRLYSLILNGKASKFELEEYYTLDEALKLYALCEHENDIKALLNQDAREEARSRR